MPNIRLNNNRYTVDTLYQWDLNQVLEIYGAVSVKDPEIHFYNETMTRAIVKQPTVNTAGVISVKIPNSILQKPFKITVKVCGYESATFKTYYKFDIPVKARKQPGDYTLSVSDDEVYSFNALEKQIADIANIKNSVYDEYNDLYSYTNIDIKLSETKATRNILTYIPLISTSLKAIKNVIDKIIELVNNKANKKDVYTTIQVDNLVTKAISDTVKIYDSNNDGVIDNSDHANNADNASNSEKLNNQSASYYATAQNLTTTNQKLNKLTTDVTEIKQVEALPTDPVATTLYLIP